MKRQINSTEEINQMKRAGLVAAITAVMIMISSALCFAADSELRLVSSYPEDGQTNTSMENLGVKLTFSNPINLFPCELKRYIA